MGNQTNVRCTLPLLTPDRLERFWSLVDEQADCWLWRGPTAHGQPQAHLSRRPRVRVRAYVVAWELEHEAPVPAFALLIGTCGEVMCIRPAHRRVGSLADLPHNSDEAATARFWATVDQSAGRAGCWPWAGRHRPGRYVQTTWHGKAIGAHRLAWQLANGPIPEGRWVLHHCDNPPCCNPAHLFAGTAADNTRDMIRKGRKARLGGTAHYGSKLTAEQVYALRVRHLRDGTSFYRLAKDTGMTAMPIWKAVTGRSYRDVPMPPDTFPNNPADALANVGGKV